MRDLYDQLIADGEASIAQLVSERRQENVSLEFKTKSNSATGELNRDDRRNLGIALSAFAKLNGRTDRVGRQGRRRTPTT